MNISKMAQDVTFITKKVISDCQTHNQNSLFNDNRNALDHFEMSILSLWRVAEMVKCKKSTAKALTDKGRLQKGQNGHLGMAANVTLITKK